MEHEEKVCVRGEELILGLRKKEEKRGPATSKQT